MTLNRLNMLLRSHDLIQDLKFDRALREEFYRDQSAVLDRYPLLPEERLAIERHDFAALYELGVHPYLLAQLSRLLFGNVEGEATSDAAVALLRSLAQREPEAESDDR